MTKLKCWKKIGKGKLGIGWARKDNLHQNVIVSKMYIGKDWAVDYSDLSIGKNISIEKNKLSAIKSASKYMRKHDKC